jgi:hypothetical protein
MYLEFLFCISLLYIQKKGKHAGNKLVRALYKLPCLESPALLSHLLTQRECLPFPTQCHHWVIARSDKNRHFFKGPAVVWVFSSNVAPSVFGCWYFLRVKGRFFCRKRTPDLWWVVQWFMDWNTRLLVSMGTCCQEHATQRCWSGRDILWLDGRD